MDISIWFGGWGFFIIYGIMFFGFFGARKLFSVLHVLWPTRSAFVWGVSVPLSLYMYVEWGTDGLFEINLHGLGSLRFFVSVLVLSQLGWLGGLVYFLAGKCNSLLWKGSGFWISVFSVVCHLLFLMLFLALAFSS